MEEDPRDTGVCTVSGFQSVVERRMMVPLNEYELRRIMFRFDTRQSHESVVRTALRVKHSDQRLSPPPSLPSLTLVCRATGRAARELPGLHHVPGERRR